MTTYADPHTCERLQWDVDDLINPGALLDQLSALLPEPTSTPDNNSIRRTKCFGSPPPWHGEAADILTTIHAGARDVEADLRYLVTGTTRRRGGSDGNTRRALVGIVRLAYAAPAAAVDDAAAQVARWVTSARQIKDIDQADRWTPLPRSPGHMPPPCPYCDAYTLRMSRRAGEVRCINPECVDGRGRRPVARMAVGVLSGDAFLAFGDGCEVVYR